MGAPFQTAAQLRVDAEKEVDKIVEKVAASNQSGGLREINKQYRAYRLAQVAKAEKATSYAAFIEQHYTISIVRSVAAVGKMMRFSAWRARGAASYRCNHNATAIPIRMMASASSIQF